VDVIQPPGVYYCFLLLELDLQKYMMADMMADTKDGVDMMDEMMGGCGITGN
jgi:hypothetical protein